MNLTTVIDPGHGGVEAMGGSSPNRATGPNGLLEKDLVLDIARRLAGLLDGAGEVLLTRDSDRNLPLFERARQAKDRNAGVFVSLHFHGSANTGADASEAWVARNSSPRSRALAEVLVKEIAEGAGAANWGVRERDLGVLVQSAHAADTAACLLEIAHLTNPRRASSLEAAASRQAIAEALNRGMRRYFAAGAS